MKKTVSLSVSLILTILVFSFSLVSGESSGNQSLVIAEAIKRFIDSLFPDWELSLSLIHQIVRKGAHVAEYTLLGMSWLFTFSLFGLKKAFFPLLGLLVALADEGIQFLADERGPSLFDALVFDFPGFMLGGIIVFLFIKAKKNKVAT
ncbi:MAG: VanZ family protein [Candidatus Izemoplasmatales bacterium]|jgi:VanZ family protein